MTSIQQVIANNSKMHEIALEIQATYKFMQEMPSRGTQIGERPLVISGLIQTAKESICLLMAQHRALSKESFEALRAFEVQDCKEIDFTSKPMPIAYEWDGDTNQQYKVAAMVERINDITLVTPVNKNAA